jgi:hypothetical protein
MPVDQPTSTPVAVIASPAGVPGALLWERVVPFFAEHLGTA